MPSPESPEVLKGLGNAIPTYYSDCEGFFELRPWEQQEGSLLTRGPRWTALFLVSDTGSCYLAQADLELTTLPLSCCEYSCEPPCPASVSNKTTSIHHEAPLFSFLNLSTPSFHPRSRELVFFSVAPTVCKDLQFFSFCLSVCLFV